MSHTYTGYTATVVGISLYGLDLRGAGEQRSPPIHYAWVVIYISAKKTFKIIKKKSYIAGCKFHVRLI
jgi:hypothetical protein